VGWPELVTGNWQLPPEYKKKGATAAPFSAGEAAYRFLPPFFFPPLAVFFAIALYPSLHSWVLARALTVSRCCLRHVSV
jgi:hypothetical protein